MASLRGRFKKPEQKGLILDLVLHSGTSVDIKKLLNQLDILINLYLYSQGLFIDHTCNTNNLETMSGVLLQATCLSDISFQLASKVKRLDTLIIAFNHVLCNPSKVNTCSQICSYKMIKLKVL